MIWHKYNFIALPTFIKSWNHQKWYLWNIARRTCDLPETLFAQPFHFLGTVSPTPPAPSKSPSYCIAGFWFSVTSFHSRGSKAGYPTQAGSIQVPLQEFWNWTWEKSRFFPVKVLDVSPGVWAVSPPTWSVDMEGPGPWRERMGHVLRDASWLGFSLIPNHTVAHWCQGSPQYP